MQFFDNRLPSRENDSHKHFLTCLLLKLVSAVFKIKLCFMFCFFFEQSTLKRNLFYNCFVSPSFHEHLSSLERSPSACLLKTYCFEEITFCVIKTMLAPWTFVPAHKGLTEVNQQTKHKSR